jgi:hypothetical protein
VFKVLDRSVSVSQQNRSLITAGLLEMLKPLVFILSYDVTEKLAKIKTPNSPD